MRANIDGNLARGFVANSLGRWFSHAKLMAILLLMRGDKRYICSGSYNNSFRGLDSRVNAVDRQQLAIISLNARSVLPFSISEISSSRLDTCALVIEVKGRAEVELGYVLQLQIEDKRAGYNRNVFKVLLIRNRYSNPKK